MTVIAFPTRKLVDRQNAAWETYKAAALRAQESLSMADGFAAGKAWAKFLDLFLEQGSDGSA